MNNVEEDVQSVVDAYLSLGSNMGDRLGHLKAATHALAQSENIEVIKVSSVYETDPWGYEDQRPFYNAVIRIRTTLSPWNCFGSARPSNTSNIVSGRSAGDQEPWISTS